MSFHSQFGSKRPVLFVLGLLIGALLLPVEQARGQSIKTDGDVVADGVSLQEFKAEYCEHLERLHAASPLPLSCVLPAGTRFVFVTSRSSDSGGDLVTWANTLINPQQAFTDGLAAADAICQYHADNATTPLPGTYKAWLSTDTVDAKERIGDYKWVLTDATTLVADSLADLLTCDPDCLNNPINRDEKGTQAASIYVYTGTSELGTRTNLNCNNWTEPTDAANYTEGLNSQKFTNWTRGSDVECQLLSQVYCFGN